MSLTPSILGQYVLEVLDTLERTGGSINVGRSLQAPPDGLPRWEVTITHGNASGRDSSMNSGVGDTFDIAMERAVTQFRENG